jgi:hypothetical protein
MRKTAGWTVAGSKSNTEIVRELSITPLFGQNTGLQKEMVAT